MIKWVLTFLLSCIAVGAIAIDLGLSLKYIFQQITMSEKLNLNKSFWIVSGLTFVASMALIGILLLWNSQARNLLDILIILSAFISLLSGVSLVESSWSSRWWKNLQNRKRKH